MPKQTCLLNFRIYDMKSKKISEIIDFYYATIKENHIRVTIKFPKLPKSTQNTFQIDYNQYGLVCGSLGNRLMYDLTSQSSQTQYKDISMNYIKEVQSDYCNFLKSQI